MRSPRRLSSPTTSERRRPRSEPSERPVSFKGIWTRRPSARIAMATWRRLRPSNRPKAGLQYKCPAERAVRAVYEALGDHATTRTALERIREGSAAAVGAEGAARSARERRPHVEPMASRTSRDRRSPDGLFPTNLTLSARVVSPPALSRLENEGGAGQRGKDQHDPEGLSLQHASHLINTSAGRRRG